MSINITAAFKHSYQLALMQAFQQTPTKLRGAMRNEVVEGDSKYISTLASTAAHEISAANATTVNTDYTMTTRKLVLRRFAHAPLIDSFDEQKLIVSPEDDLVRSAVYAMNRQIDDLIIDSFDATVVSGRNGVSTTAFDSAMTVTATGGLTVAKLREVKRMLDLKEADPDRRYIMVSPYQVDNLLGQTEVTSSDYNVVKALVQGDVDSFMGFKFIVSNRINQSAAVRHCFAWTFDSMAFGLGKDINVKMSERDDKNYSLQIFHEMFIGAIRLREDGVVKINVTQS